MLFNWNFGSVYCNYDALVMDNIVFFWICRTLRFLLIPCPYDCIIHLCQMFYRQTTLKGFYILKSFECCNHFLVCFARSTILPVLVVTCERSPQDPCSDHSISLNHATYNNQVSFQNVEKMTKENINKTQASTIID